MTFRVDRLDVADAGEVARLHRLSFDHRLPWLAGLHTPTEDEAFFRDRIFASCGVWGARDGDALIGFVAFRDGWIDQLYLLPDRQGRGVGRALLRLAKAASPVLQLWTFQRNTGARRFYEANGFAIVRETDGSGNEEREPDVLYRWAAGARSG